MKATASKVVNTALTPDSMIGTPTSPAIDWHMATIAASAKPPKKRNMTATKSIKNRIAQPH
jgi:hypothetical protein